MYIQSITDTMFVYRVERFVINGMLACPAFEVLAIFDPALQNFKTQSLGR